MKIRILVLSTIIFSLSLSAFPQKLSISPFGKAQFGYGIFRGYTDPNYNFFTSVGDVNQNTYQIFQGLDFCFNIGAALHRPGSDIYRESFFDIFLAYKRLMTSSNSVGFTGVGVRVRYQFFYGGMDLGVATNRNEISVELDSQNNALNSGDLHGLTPMFNLGLRAPLNSGHTLFLDIPFDFVIPKNRLNDEPAGSAALYEWYNFSLGICYYLPI